MRMHMYVLRVRAGFRNMINFKSKAMKTRNILKITLQMYEINKKHVLFLLAVSNSHCLQISVSVKRLHRRSPPIYNSSETTVSVVLGY
jgi:hypothetical protein